MSTKLVYKSIPLHVASESGNAPCVVAVMVSIWLLVHRRLRKLIKSVRSVEVTTLGIVPLPKVAALTRIIQELVQREPWVLHLNLAPLIALLPPTSVLPHQHYFVTVAHHHVWARWHNWILETTQRSLLLSNIAQGVATRRNCIHTWGGWSCVQVGEDWRVCVIQFFNRSAQVIRDTRFAFFAHDWGAPIKSVRKGTMLPWGWGLVDRFELLNLAEVHRWRLWCHLVGGLRIIGSLAIWVCGLAVIFALSLVDSDFDRIFRLRRE